MNTLTSILWTVNRHKFQFLMVVLILFGLFSTSLAPAKPAVVQAVSAPRAAGDFEQTQLSFIPNAGQNDPSVVFQSHSLGGNLFFRSREVVLSLPDLSGASDESERSSHVVSLWFDNANPEMQITGGDLLPGKVNYFRGNDPANWYTDLTTYSEIVYEQLYPGIDLHYTGTEGVLKGTYIVAPGADSSQIRWRYNGINELHIDPATGDLVIDAAEEMQLIERAPIAWQTINGQQIPVDIHYTLNDDHSLQFALGEYNAAYPLVLDPDLQYSTYFGGINTDQGTAIAVDTKGNTYIVGLTASTTFPTVGAWKGALGGTADAFITKLNSSGTAVFSTYFGGNSYDNGTGIALDATGVYLVGETESVDFPTTTGAFQVFNGGSSDVFVSKISLNGSSLIYSTYLGGSDYDSASGLAVYNQYAHITGKTTSTNFDKLYATQPNIGGTTDAFVTKLNTNGQSLIFSTYLGGENIDIGEAIAIGINGVVFVAGRTQSTNFPVFGGAYSTLAGLQDAFVAKYSTTGTRLFSTYLGSPMDDAAYGLVIDSAGNPYITGETEATNNFPVPTGNPPLISHGGADVFVARLSSAGNSLQFSTLIGGSGNDGGAGIALDAANNVYVTGNTESSNFPVVNYFEGHGTYKLATDAFVLKLLAGTSTLDYSSYLGGPAEDRGLGIAVDSYGAVLVIGNTESNTMLPNSLRQFGGMVDAFIVRIGSLSAELFVGNIDTPDPVQVGETLTYTITVRNFGPDAAGNVVITEPLPYEVSYVSATFTTGSGTCEEASGTVTCTVPSMAANTSVVIDVATNVVMGGTINNNVTVTSDQFDPESGNNFSSQTTSATAVANLDLKMTADTYLPAVNKTVTFTLTIENLGPSAASNVRIVDALPAGLTYKSHSATLGSYNKNLGLWQISILNVNQPATLTLEATVTAAKGTEIANLANATASQFDDDMTNNSDGVTLKVTSGMPLSGCHQSKTDPTIILCLSS